MFALFHESTSNHYYFTRHAIRMNIQFNWKNGKVPRGRLGVEHNNLYLKVRIKLMNLNVLMICMPQQKIYGKFSNHTKHRILKESSLLGVFKSSHILVNKIFQIGKQTTSHSGPKLRRTFQAIGYHLIETQSNKFVPGRKVVDSIPDQIVRRQHIVVNTSTKPVRGEHIIRVTDKDPDRAPWEDLNDKEEELEEGDFSD